LSLFPHDILRLNLRHGPEQHEGSMCATLSAPVRFVVSCIPNPACPKIVEGSVALPSSLLVVDALPRAHAYEIAAD